MSSLVELGQHADNWEAADELGDEAVVDKVLGFKFIEGLVARSLLDLTSA